MSQHSIILLTLVTTLVGSSSPPFCTTVTKETSYTSKFKLEYAMSYIPVGQGEGYQLLYCLNPPTVHSARTTACDWLAPPQVHFTLDDEYVRVIRQDPSGQYLGNAIITTTQMCQHNMSDNNVFRKPIATTVTEGGFCSVTPAP